ncbi:spore germination protein GerPB [Mesobacillus zeae]
MAGDIMNFYIQQSIQINQIKISSVTNSSVLQIGSAGIIKPNSYLYNTGGFTGPAPQAQQPGSTVIQAPSVPL